MDFSEVTRGEILFTCFYLIPLVVGILLNLPEVIKLIKEDLASREVANPPLPKITVMSLLYGMFCVGCPVLNILFMLESIWSKLPDLAEQILDTPIFAKRRSK